jgi:hypothetical protein
MRISITMEGWNTEEVYGYFVGWYCAQKRFYNNRRLEYGRSVTIR